MRLSGTGAWVIDEICDVRSVASDQSVKQYFSSESNPRGIVRGAAILKTDLERQFGQSIDRILGEILVPGRSQKTLGGVAAATLIGASQMLEGHGTDVFFYTNVGDDENGRIALDQLSRSPLRLDKVRKKRARCPTSIILNEAPAGDTRQERSFLSESNAGKDLMLDPSDLDNDFYASDISFFASLFWEPRIKADLTRILRKCKESGSITAIGASSDPNLRGVTRRWELGDREEMYRYLDILVMDKSEALAYSGETELGRAFEYFKKAGVKSFLVTDGLEPTSFFSDGSVFREAEGRLPTAQSIIRDKETGRLPTGDTVGCGDNFAGGVLASLVTQLESGQRPSIEDAAILGNLCGAFASSYPGGTYYEQEAGEKRKRIEAYLGPYKQDLSNTGA
jgi:sugar/nucleoside kinase (ribokinase family)